MASAKKLVKPSSPPFLVTTLIKDKVQCCYPCTFEAFNNFPAVYVYVTGLSQLAGIL
jgi:hypothetical protein